MKTRTFSENVKIHPQEYVMRGTHSLYYLQKVEKHRPNSVLTGENEYANFVEKRQNRPSGIRLSGVPPPSTISKKSKNIERTLLWWAKIKTRTLSKNVKIDSHSGVPPPLCYLLRLQKRTLFWWARIRWAKTKSRTFSKNVKIHPQEYVLQGSPLPLLSTKIIRI